MSSSLDLSVVIITLNEEASLSRCLASLPQGCEIVVLDSGSTDQTVEIAKRFGARAAQRPFDDYASQKNEAIQRASRSWVLSLDADEVLTPELSEEIRSLIEQPAEPSVVYRLRRKLVFLGRVLRFGKTQDHPIRLFPKGSGIFHHGIHETFAPAKGVRRVESLHGALLHESYRNLTDYFERFNRYTSLVSAEHRREHIRLTGVSFLRHVLRPWVEFVSRYFLRLGFLDGYPGYVYALNSSLYAFIKYAKVVELEKS